MNKWKKYILASDIFSLYLALILAIIVRGLIHTHANQNEAVWLAAHTLIFLPSLLFSLLALYISGLYDSKIIFDRGKSIPLLIYAQFSTALFSIISFYVLQTSLTPRLTIFIYLLLSIIVLSLTRNYIFTKLQKLPKIPAVFFSQNKQLLNKIEASFAPLTFICLDQTDKIILEIKNKTNYLVYDEKILNTENSLFIEKLKHMKVNVYSYNQYFEFLFKKIDFENFNLNDFIATISEGKEKITHYLFRRSIDIFCGLIILPFFLFSLPFIYIAIYFQDKKSIFSVQDRISFLGNRIWVYKYRTMTNTDSGGIVDNDKNKNEISKFGNSVTKFGKFMRKTRIDELPQCLNLIKGDISAIGPRADILGVNQDMQKNIENYNLRLLVEQGLTGWAQVHMNFPPRTYEEHRERSAHDLYYIKNRSILIDISIILKTIKTLISREGA